MDGDIAPLYDLAALARRYDAWLLSDDAHGLGVVGSGRGSSFVRGTKADVPLQMGTLSKAIGAYGGYLCASSAVVELIRNRARTLIYSTGLPPAILAPLADISRWLKATRTDSVLVGGVAVSLLSRPRFTQDVDALA